jgi:hypothetical protein
MGYLAVTVGNLLRTRSDVRLMLVVICCLDGCDGPECLPTKLVRTFISLNIGRSTRAVNVLCFFCRIHLVDKIWN